MRLKAMSLTVLLCFGVLSMWVEERWAWSLFPVGIFALFGSHAIGTRHRCQAGFALVPLAVAAAWPFVQLALGSSVCGS